MAGVNIGSGLNMSAGGLSFDKTPVNQLNVDERQAFCEETVYSLITQLPLGSERLNTYIDKVCFLLSITRDNQVACESEFQGCFDQFSQVFQSYDALLEQCLFGDVFYDCGAATRDVLTCNQSIKLYEVELIMNMNLYGFTCSSAGDSMAISSITAQYSAPPMSLCEPKAYECLMGI